jgi:predicted alpha/beta hydrolase
VDGLTRDFYVRQLQDWKGSAEVEAMVPKGMLLYGQLCAWTLARAHARSGDRVAIAAYLGDDDSFAQSLTDFSEAYADLNERDFQRFGAAVQADELLGRGQGVMPAQRRPTGPPSTR